MSGKSFESPFENCWEEPSHYIGGGVKKSIFHLGKRGTPPPDPKHKKIITDPTKVSKKMNGFGSGAVRNKTLTLPPDPKYKYIHADPKKVDGH